MRRLHARIETEVVRSCSARAEAASGSRAAAMRVAAAWMALCAGEAALAGLPGLKVAEAPWSVAEWAVALRFVELLQAQPGRHGTYHLL